MSDRPDEIWTTRDGRKLKVGEMEEAHVRDALRMVIRRARKREERARAALEIHKILMEDVENDWVFMQPWTPGSSS